MSSKRARKHPIPLMYRFDGCEGSCRPRLIALTWAFKMACRDRQDITLRYGNKVVVRVEFIYSTARVLVPGKEVMNLTPDKAKDFVMNLARELMSAA